MGDRVIRGSGKSGGGHVEEIQSKRSDKAKLDSISPVSKRKKAEMLLAAVGAGKEKALRKTGIDILGNVAWGTHFCLFYQNKRDLTDILVPYFKAGLENNEFCIWITSEPLDAEDTKKSLNRAVKNVDAYIEKGQIEILDYDQWYTKTGKFEADNVLHGWVQKHDEAINRGFDGLRLTGNTFWLEKEDWRQFIEYEARVNYIIGKYRMLAICTYSLDRGGANEVIDVVNSHQFAFIKRKGCWEIVESAERKRANEMLWQSEQKYRDLAEQMTEGLGVADADRILTYVNPRIAEILEYSPQDMVGKHCFAFVDEESMHLVKKEADKRARGIGGRFELVLTSKTGKKIPVMVSARPVFIDGKYVGSYALFIDITERKKAEEAYRSLVDHLLQGLAIFQDGRVVFANQAMANITGYTVQEMLAMSPDQVQAFVHPDDRHTVWTRHRDRLNGITAPERYELRGIRKDGSVCWLEIHASRIEYQARPAIQAAYVDVTGRRQVEDRLLAYQGRLKSLASQLTLAEERERRRVATELHDRISQTLAICKLELDALRHGVNSRDAAAVLKTVSDSLSQAMGEVRSLTFDLSFPILHELGFEAAVGAWLVGRIREKFAIETELEDDRQPKPLDDDVRVLLFRDVRELLINVVKHAQAKKVRVSIRRLGSLIQVSVQDDGVGFEPAEVAAKAAPDGGFGLFSIRESLEQLGGRLTVDSNPGHGTTVTLTAPLKGTEKETGDKNGYSNSAG